MKSFGGKALCHQATTDEIKRMNAMSATLRRLCTPKALSGKLEVSAEIYKQWSAGGSQRKVLLDILCKTNGDKAGQQIF